MTAYEVAVRAEATLGEGPTWDAAGDRLLWIDILGSRLHTYEPATGRRTVRTTEQHIGAVKPRAGGGLVLNLRDGVGLLDPDGAFRWLHHEPVPGRRANDAAVAPDGALWAGTMRYDEAPGGGTLSRLTGDGTVDVVLDDVTVSNGTGWSPDGRLMYYVDTPTRRIDVFDVEGTRVTGRRPLAEIEESAASPTASRSTRRAVCGWRCGTAGRSAATRPAASWTGSSRCRLHASRRARSGARTSGTCTSPRPAWA
ncbi:hypothetical protein SGLAM104S_03160 [Streptomyces glaucescens]